MVFALLSFNLVSPHSISITVARSATATSSSKTCFSQKIITWKSQTLAWLPCTPLASHCTPHTARSVLRTGGPLWQNFQRLRCRNLVSGRCPTHYHYRRIFIQENDFHILYTPTRTAAFDIPERAWRFWSISRRSCTFLSVRSISASSHFDISIHNRILLKQPFQLVVNVQFYFSITSWLCPSCYPKPTHNSFKPQILKTLSFYYPETTNVQETIASSMSIITHAHISAFPPTISHAIQSADSPSAVRSISTAISQPRCASGFPRSCRSPPCS